MHKHTFIFLVVIAQLLIGCDLFTSKKDEKIAFSPSSKCRLDTDAITNYFVREITPELRCLESYLNDFIRFVKTDKPGFLSLDELTKFIKNDFHDFDQDLLGPIAAVFEMNSLLYGDHPKYISRNHVESLVNVFIEVNKVVVAKKVYEHFIDSTEKNYDLHNQRKADIFEAFTRIKNVLKSEYKENTNMLSLTSFLDKFEKIDESNLIENSEKLVFIKKIFLGGDKSILTAKELSILLDRVPDVIKFVFDLSQFKYIDKDLNEEEKLIQTLNAGSVVLKRSLFYGSTSLEQLFTIEDLFSALEIFFPVVSEYRTYKNEIKKAKSTILFNDSESFSGAEVYHLVDSIVHENLNRGEFFYRAYILNQHELDGEEKISSKLKTIIFSDDKEIKYFDTFNRIVKDYSYFKGESKSATFSQSLKRSPYALFEISVLEDLIKRVVAKYATHEDKSLVFGKGLTQENLDFIFAEYKKPLVNEGVIFEGRSDSTAETFTLMTTLFQGQSSGDGVMSVNELTEFAVGLLSSSSIGSFVHEKMTELCKNNSDCSLDSKGRYSPDFYRAELNTVLNMDYGDKRVRDYYPGLYSYLQRNDSERFLKVTEKFARSCTHFKDGKDTPMSGGDYFNMFVGMTAIEQTINRFDKHGASFDDLPDGILQSDEVMAAFPIYKSAVEGIIPSASLKKYSKVFFQYLIKYERVPDIEGGLWSVVKGSSHFLKFLLTPERKRLASADRYTFAKILEVLSDFSPASKANPFPCEILR